MKLIGISGSLRRDSHNTHLLQLAATVLPAGVELEILERLDAIPAYNEDVDREATPMVVKKLRRDVAQADAVLIATPEYNSSVPGQLKNVLDWLSRPFPDNALRNKPIAVIGASQGMFGAVWAQAEVRKIAKAIGARVVESELPVGKAHEAFDADGRLADDEQHERFEQLLGELVAQAEQREAVAA